MALEEEDWDKYFDNATADIDNGDAGEDWSQYFDEQPEENIG